MEKKIFVVLNPAAGFAADPQRVRRKLETWQEANPCQIEIYETREDEDLTAVVQHAVRSGADIIAAAGGDGTISLVSAGMINSPVPLLILPTGTGNLLAHEMGMPGDLHRALDLIHGGSHTLQLDAMSINGRHGVLNMGVGFSSNLIKNTARKDKRKFGILAYFAAAVRALLGLQPYSFRLTVDGKKFVIRASEIFVANGGLLGIKLPFEDFKILPDDGRVDLFVIRARTLGDYLEMLWYILRGKPRSSRKMFYIQAAEEILIQCNKRLPAQADGEVIGETPVQIKVLPRAVPVLCPDKGETAEPLRELIRSWMIRPLG